jgi:hypothetical protein
LNLFDDGTNIINKINYNYWLSDAQNGKWIKLSFTKPVIVHSFLIETTGKYQPREFAVELSQLKAGTRRTIREFNSVAINGFRTVFDLPEPVSKVDEVTVLFPGAEMIQVGEIRVWGTAPAGVNLTPQKPLIALSEPEKQGSHIIDIQRIIHGENDLKMITLAENVYPDRANIIEATIKARWREGPFKAASRNPLIGKEREVEKAKLRNTLLEDKRKLWWYDEFDGIRIPYAITGDTIRYYEEQVRSFRQRKWKSDIEPSSSLTYRTSVEFKKNFKKDKTFHQNVYVVTMKLSFSAQFASLAGLGFTKERTIVLDHEGKVLEIWGDGVTQCLVS